MIEQRLWEFATPTQRKYLAKAHELGSGSKAADFFGVSHGTVNRSLSGLRKRVEKIHCRPVLERIEHAEPQHKDGPKKLLLLPDVQAKRGTDFSFLMRIGQYAVEKKPDIILCIGDFADMESLSGYDKGKKTYEGRRYSKDIEAAKEAMSAFLTPMVDYNATHPQEPYRPRMVLTLGNHEDRILRAINEDPKLDGTISVNDLQYEDFGWEVHPFLEVVVIEGVAFSHYFVTGVMGRPASSAAAQLRAANMSCCSGHQQGKQIAYAKRADGAILTSIIAGSCYEHDEGFLGPQINKQHWRGFFMLHELADGKFDEMPVSIGFINQRYPNIHVAPNYAEVPQPEGMR